MKSVGWLIERKNPNKKMNLIEAKPILDFPGYFAYKDGQIWSEPKKNPIHPGAINGNNSTGKFLKPYRNLKGYLEVCLYRNGKQYHRSVHRLVLEAWVGPCPKSQETNHKDNNPLNNCLENLEWTTHQRNEDHKVKQGRQAHVKLLGVSNGNHKLNQEQVLLIKQLLSQGLLQKQIAKQFNVDQGAISHIKLGKNWGWLK